MEGFIIAYFKTANVNKIIPAAWVADVDTHLEKFLNAGLNSAQTYTCFYTNNAEAFDAQGLPKTDFPSNFDAPFRGDFDGDGRFAIKLKSYKGKNKSILFGIC